jgi:hypothetical protein
MDTSSKKVADITTDIMGSKLTITVSNGEFIELDVTKLSPAMQLQAMLHGMKQKIVDAAAIPRNTETGKSATISDKYEAMLEVANRVMFGEWNKARGDGSGKGSKSYLCEALMELYKKDRATVTNFLKGKSADEKAALSANAKVVAIVARLQAEKVAASGIDSDAILGELE